MERRPDQAGTMPSIRHDDPAVTPADIRTSRRVVLGGVASATLLSACSYGGLAGNDIAPRTADAIAGRIQRPRIPPRDFAVADHGGLGDGRTDNTAAIVRTIDACAAAGGGRIVLPRGLCLTGPIRLRSRMALHVPEGSHLRFIPEPDRYLPPVFSRWEGVELMGYHPLIYAFEESDVAITGHGTIDGGADDDHWWPWKGPWNGKFDGTSAGERQAADRARLFDLAERGVPVEQRVFGTGSRLRPPLFQPYRSHRVLVEGVTITNSPFWLLHPVLCRDVVFRDLTCRSHGPNNDGIDPESCTNVLIERCTFDTGDDCIAIKAGRNADGRRLAAPCENIVVRHCRMQDGHAGVAIGSELTGGVRNVFVEDCRMDSPHLTRALEIKTNGYRGGIVEDIHLKRLRIGVVERALVQLWMFYEEGSGGTFVPVIRRIAIDDCTVGRTERLLVIRGRPDSPVTDLSLTNIHVLREDQPSVVVDATRIRVQRVVVNGQAWTHDTLTALPGMETIRCDKWAVCRTVES